LATQVTLPRLGQGMEAGTIVRWLKTEGDAVDRDEALYELDTDKVTQEVEAGVSGVLLKILAGEGAEVAVGKPIAVIGEPGEDVPADTDGGGTTAPAESPEVTAEPHEAPAESVGAGPVRPAEAEATARAPEPAPAGDGGRVKASPLARRIARERDIDLRRVDGTGPDGRIVAEDVERAAAAPAWEAKPVPAADTGETVKLTSIRRTIARRLSKAWEAPHFAISSSADMRRVVELRETLLERTAEGEPRPTYSDVLTKLCSVALLRHPALNAHYEGDSVRIFATASVGIAVAIENGLVVPVIHNAELRSIPELAEARVDLVERTRVGKLTPADLEGGTFTISNLGMYGVERFFAVLNPPQVAILAVGAIEDRVVAEDGQPVVRPRMDLTLSCDHRGVDGATAAEFLRTLRQLLEEPGLAL
jgi:pyruvate dehydrogenase E2 component (dihydrolipoamide acetyltransferase)